MVNLTCAETVWRAGEEQVALGEEELQRAGLRGPSRAREAVIKTRCDGRTFALAFIDDPRAFLPSLHGGVLIRKVEEGLRGPDG